MKKKFKVTLVVFLVVVLGCFSQVFAATNQNNKADKISQVRKNARFLQSASTDNGVVGTSNLNGTADNSAKVGDSLTSPEIGWKRYDDSNNKFIGNGGLATSVNVSSSEGIAYKNTIKQTSSANYSITFKFYGTKLIVSGGENTNRSSDIEVEIDGVEDTFSQYNSKYNPLSVDYKKTGLDLKVHTVKITNLKEGYFCFDYIDIDSTGYLIDPSATLVTGITLNKTTDSLPVGQTDTTLTATVTPDNATNKTVIWKSSDEGIVKVDQNTGVITAQSKAGTATITATTTDGTNLSASCTVTVTESTNPTDSSDKAVLNITMTNGQVKQYNVTMDEVNKFISWYRLRSAGSGDPFYEFDITQTSSPSIIKTDYVVFDKISSFEVDDYIK